MEGIKAKDTLAIATYIVLPNDTNTLTNLMGGQLLNWMDIVSAISAGRFCKRVVVTASVSNVSFQLPIQLGNIVTLEAKVSRSFNKSCEVFIEVYKESQLNGIKTKCNEAMYTFVALNEKGETVTMPELIPETDLEKERYTAALRRKQLSLILAGRMKPEDATELKALFF
ncbi:MAG: acyl-CoA thioesterase [Bacteroidetes bacterium]|nr:acyl-CoA thioesterase [Bacteroidota bacterium]